MKYTKWASIRKSNNINKSNLPKKSLQEEINKLKEEGYYIINDFQKITDEE